MKLLYLLENYWPHIGGMETLMAQLCGHMAARGHDVTVVTRSLPNVPRKERRDGAEIIRINSPVGRFSFPVAAFPMALHLASRHDVIHTATFSAAPLGSIVGGIAKKPVVLTVPELWIGKWRTFSDASVVSATLFDLLERAIFAFPFNAYVGISNYTAQRLHAYIRPMRANIQTIYCGFDPAPWTTHIDRPKIRARIGVTCSDFLVVAYGRPGISKGFRYLVEAFPDIARRIPNVKMRLILSDGRATAHELAYIKRHADSRIVFERPLALEALTETVKAADCVVVPSLAEGFGYAALEAATAGVPLVVSDSTSMHEVVGGRYQFSTPRNVESIAKAVEQISHGEYLESNVPQFDWDTAIDKYERLYERVMRTNSEPRARRFR